MGLRLCRKLTLLKSANSLAYDDDVERIWHSLLIKTTIRGPDTGGICDELLADMERRPIQDVIE